MHWQKDEESDWGFSRMKLNQYHIGRMVSTTTSTTLEGWLVYLVLRFNSFNCCLDPDQVRRQGRRRAIEALELINLAEALELINLAEALELIDLAEALELIDLAEALELINLAEALELINLAEALELIDLAEALELINLAEAL